MSTLTETAADQRHSGAQTRVVGGTQTPAPAIGRAIPIPGTPERAQTGAADHPGCEAHQAPVGGALNVERVDQSRTDTLGSGVDPLGPQAPAPARDRSTPIATTPERAQAGAADQLLRDTHGAAVGSAPNVREVDQGSSAPQTRAVDLADPLLALAADVLDDLERVRIANENRLRQLTRTEEDSDGLERGFGLPESHPDVARLKALVDSLAAAEHQAELNLRRMLRVHPLGPWVRQARGVGEKQAARLLAAIGDPYWNDLHDRPRLVSELWSYAGYGDAAKQVRRKGEKARWSATAKMRAYLVSVSIVKAGGPYREVYDAARAKHADAVHLAECRRCGPAGKPAQPGSPLSAGHQHARALRAVSKEVLRDLWLEARRLHETLPGGQPKPDTQVPRAAGES